MKDPHNGAELIKMLRKEMAQSKKEGEASVSDKGKAILRAINKNKLSLDFLNITSPITSKQLFEAIDESTMKNLMDAEDILTSALKNNLQ